MVQTKGRNSCRSNAENSGSSGSPTGGFQIVEAKRNQRKTTANGDDGLIPVPEPAIVIAGARLLLPFGASTIRFIRKRA